MSQLLTKIGLLFIILLLPTTLFGQRRVSVAFWNVENLYDTIPSLFYDDREYTPNGANKWGAERYVAKLKNLSRVLDDMSADVVGLAEVESEEAVRDLVMTLHTDYNYIHKNSGDSRGMDVSMLYKGDKFFPETIKQAGSGMRRQFLVVTGELLDEQVHIVVCHMASNLNDYAFRLRSYEALRGLLEKLLKDDPAANIIVIGDMNATPSERVVRRTLGSVSSPYDFMYSPHWEAYKAGKGSYNYRDRWYLYDWMLVSPTLARGRGVTATGGGIFAKEYMTTSTGRDVSSPRKPLRTFTSGDYTSGYSDHLPVYLYIKKE
jgi:endonuclease/exonuclease/phosphatase family metal-dependent hydrolase